MCVGAASVQLEDTSCTASLRPVAVQPCSMPACLLPVRWHVGDWGLCSKSCASGLRERQNCNTQTLLQPTGGPQYAGSQRTRWLLSLRPDHATVLRPDSVDPQTNTVYDPHSSGPAQHCSQSYYGCCPDGVMAAGGTGGLGCQRGSHRPPRPEQAVCTTTSFGCCGDGVTISQGSNREGCQEYGCINSRYGCCRDGVSAAQGLNKEGCPEYVPPAPPTAPPLPLLSAENSIQCRLTTYGCCFDRMSAAAGPDGEGCPTHTQQCSQNHLLPAQGSRLLQWLDGPILLRCHHRQVLTLLRGSSVGSTGGRQGSSAAGHAHRARVHVRLRRPAPYAVQQTHPVASLTQPGGVKIDQSDPSTVEALVGQTVVLPCRVSPAPSSTVIVEWRRDGVPLTASRHHPQPNGSLLVGPLTKADSGWLLCVATRDRERDHRYIYLSVSEDSRGSQLVQDGTASLLQDGADRTGVKLPSVPQRQPSPRFSIDRSGSSSVEGKAGQTVRLACKIIPTSALSSVSIQWTRGGQALNSLRHAQHADGTLVIGQLTSDDSGVYTCTGSTHSQLEQRQLTLKVQGDLRITMAPNNVQVSQGSTALLPCVVSGDNVNVGWSRNGVPVRPDGGHVSDVIRCATAEVRINKASQQGIGVPAECVDQPELANCELIVYARLCTSQYYSSFCCASCARHAQGEDRYGQIG
ncbi:hypothetical protein J4Q44_G00219750 [Coregonus suidteri]|uniref:Papilin n=1 Tax=Coregonus suidteri TaxID=861788 RepID=A0AAN8L7G2_9TELE